jgi:hypothetical protein
MSKTTHISALQNAVNTLPGLKAALDFTVWRSNLKEMAMNEFDRLLNLLQAELAQQNDDVSRGRFL